jgi:hypothetical protein
MKQDHIADPPGVSQGLVSRWEAELHAGHRSVTPTEALHDVYHVVAVAQRLSVPSSDIIARKGFLIEQLVERSARVALRLAIASS